MSKQWITVCLIFMTIVGLSLATPVKMVVLEEPKTFTREERLLAANRVIQVQNLQSLYIQQGLLAFDSRLKRDIQILEQFSQAFDVAQEALIHKETLETLELAEQFSRTLGLKRSIEWAFDEIQQTHAGWIHQMPPLEKQTMAEILVEAFDESRAMIHMIMQPIVSAEGNDPKREMIEVYLMESMVLEMVNSWLVFILLDHHPSFNTYQQMSYLLDRQWQHYERLSVILHDSVRAEALSNLGNLLEIFRSLGNEMLLVQRQHGAVRQTVLQMMRELIMVMHKAMSVL